MTNKIQIPKLKFQINFIITLIIGLFLLLSCSSRPQVHKMLILTFPTADKTLDSFKKEMDSLGYREGRNIIYLIALASEEEELKVKARRLMEQKPDTIVSFTTWATRAAIDINRDSSLPHLFGQTSTLSGIGIDSREERAKLNLTGITSAVPITKQLEYMKRLAPGASRVLVVYKPDPLPLSLVLSLRDVAPAMKIDLIEKQSEDLDDLIKLLQGLKPGEIDALLQVPDSIGSFNVPVLIQAALRLKVPLSVTLEQNVSIKGALFAYVVSLEEHGKELAHLTDKVLKGIPLSRLEVEIPQKYYLTINMETAREIGLTIPPDMLSLADKLINGNEPVR